MSIVEIKTRRGSKMYTIMDKIIEAGRCILITKSGRALDVKPENIIGEWGI